MLSTGEKKLNLLQRVVSQQGKAIRVSGTYDEPWFCLKDVCECLGIVGHRNKARLLQDLQKRASTLFTPSGKQKMTCISEAVLYRVIFSCRESNIPGTAPHSFTSWVTETVLPNLRRNGRFDLEQEIRTLKSEKGRRLWIVVKHLDKFTFNIRRKHFGSVCKATEKFCYKDEFNAPHVRPENLQQVQRIIVEIISKKILDSVPSDQSSITDFYSPAIDVIIAGDRHIS